MGDPGSTSQRRTDTADPRRSRERALKILFQADVRHVTPEVTLERLEDDPAAQAMLDEVDDLADDRELLPPIAYEPGVEVERVPDEEATSRQHGSGRGRPRPTAGARRGGDAEGGAGAGGAAGGGAVELDGFTRSLVMGVHDNRARIDELIGRFARRWQVSRMPVVDRTVLRLATYELLYESTSPAVVIHEAINLAKELSTDDSGRYVNGVLESVRKHLAEGGDEADGADPDPIASEEPGIHPPQSDGSGPDAAESEEPGIHPPESEESGIHPPQSDGSGPDAAESDGSRFESSEPNDVSRDAAESDGSRFDSSEPNDVSRDVDEGLER